MENTKSINGIKNIRESFKTRQVKYGGYAALLTLGVIAALILVNLLAGQFSLQKDLTSNKLFSLSEQTVQVLDKVTTPVKFYGLWRPGDENQQITNVIKLYLSKNRNISLEVIDPDKNPGFVLKYDKDKKGIAPGSLIVEGGKGFKVIAPYDMYDINQSQSGPSITGVAVERRITGALLFAGSGTTPVVYEVTGHEELPLSALKMQEMIERENYTLKSLNLLLSDIPPDASALILNGPRKDLVPSEAKKLLDYLGKGGRFLVLADYNIGDLTNLNDVLGSYGIVFKYGVVIETDKNYMINLPLTVIPDMVDHDITKPLANKSSTPVLLQGAMAISELDTKRRSLEVTRLMKTSPLAYLRTDLRNTSTFKLPADISGPLILGAAVKDPSWIDPNKPQPQARIVAISCSNMLVISAQLGVDANKDLFMNSLTWLQDKPETISVRSKSTFLLPLRLNLVQIIIFGGLFIFIIPVAFFITGFVTWLKRRHL